MTMQYTSAGLHLTESFEGCKLTAYQDQVGVWTNGWGNTHGVIPGSTITQARAESDLLANVQSAVNTVNRLVTVPLTQNQFNALVDFTFNAGNGNFAASTLLKKLNARDYDGADAEFAHWDMAGGAHIAGLARRRGAEAAMFDQSDEGI